MYKLLLLFVWCIVHVNLLPSYTAVGLTIYANQVIAWLRIVFLAHRVECKVLYTVNILLVPLMNVTQEYDSGIPLGKPVEQEEHLLAGEG